MQTTEDRFKNIKRIGTQKKWTNDLYHNLLVFNWVQFFLTYLVFIVFFNTFFALLYWLLPNTINGTDSSFWQAFIFSVQTFSTVGYGVFSPNGNWAHSVVIVESFLSVFVTALLTGLIFAKFSRPSARIIFSKNILINNFDGKRVLTFRMSNLRKNHVAEAQLSLVLLKSIVTSEGHTLRKQIDLNLVRSTSLFFALSWSVMHIIDENSPLYNVTLENFIDENIDIGVSVIGYDSTFSQSIHANCFYAPEDVVFDKYFVDLFDINDKKVTTIDYAKFNMLKS